MLKRTIIILVATLAAGTVLAQAYKWVDENGVTNFSDRPHEGAERIQLPSDGRRPPPPQTVSSAAATAEAAPEEAAVFRYEAFTIVSPLAEETLWNIEGRPECLAQIATRRCRRAIGFGFISTVRRDL